MQADADGDFPPAENRYEYLGRKPEHATADSCLGRAEAEGFGAAEPDKDDSQRVVQQ